MMNKEPEQMNRVLPLILAEGNTTVTVPLTWSLPGNAPQFDEPELTVLDVKAVALSGEVVAEVVIEQLTYYLNEDTGLVEKQTTTYLLTELVQVPVVKPGNRVTAQVDVGVLGGWRTERDNLRGQRATILKGECKLFVSYTVFGDQEVYVYKASGFDGEALSETVDVESLQSCFTEVIDLSFPLEMAATPKSMGELSGHFKNAKVTSMCGWVKIEGEIAATVPYLTEKEQIISEVFVFPVKYFLEVNSATGEMAAEVTGEAKIFTCLREHGERTGILRGLLYLEGRLSLLEHLGVAVKSRSHPAGFQHKLPHHHKKPFLLEEVIAMGSSQTLVQREIFFPRRVRSVREPVDAQVRNLQHEVIPNKVIVKGILRKQLFAVDAETGTVFAVDVNENFVHFVDVPGASPGMRAHVKARVEFVKVDINPGGESARQVTIIEISVKVTRFVKKEIAEDNVWPVLPWPPMKPKPPHPAAKTYIVRSGDTIWKIANMFGVSMEAIIAANNLTNPNLIFPGQQLIIPS
jgi:hypothetical protein